MDNDIQQENSESNKPNKKDLANIKNASSVRIKYIIILKNNLFIILYTIIVIKQSRKS